MDSPYSLQNPFRLSVPERKILVDLKRARSLFTLAVRHGIEILESV
jgi:hypothetical protein